MALQNERLWIAYCCSFIKAVSEASNKFLAEQNIQSFEVHVELYTQVITACIDTSTFPIVLLLVLRSSNKETQKHKHPASLFIFSSLTNPIT